MSYICLMANENGAIVAADSRETFPGKVHLDWRRKCFVLPGRQLIWTCCGPTLRLGVDFFRSAWLLLACARRVEDGLHRVGALVSRVTAVPLPGQGRSDVFWLLAAQWTGEGFAVWTMCVRPGEALRLHCRRLTPGEAVSLHAGAWHREMPPLAARSLRGLSYDQLRAAARERVALAIRMDEARRARNPRHNQTIGGAVRSEGIRCRRAGTFQQAEQGRQ